MIYFSYWEKVIRLVLEMKPFELHFANEVIPILASFDSEREMKTDYYGETNPEMAETYAKSSYKIRRIAGIVHLLSEDNCIANKVPTNTITLNEFNYAVRIVEFFEECSFEVLNMMVEKNVDKLTNKQLLYELCKRFHPTKITELAAILGVSKQYVSRCFLGGDTTEIEKKEKAIKDVAGNIVEVIKETTPNLWSRLGNPSYEEIETMYNICDGKTEEIVKRLKKAESTQFSGGETYSLLISIFGDSS